MATEETKPGNGTPGATALAVAPGQPANKLGSPPAQVTAAASVSKFGGLRGGKKRADGLVPGSAQALEADRKKDAARKREARSLAEPPALPSAVQASADQGAPLPGSEGGDLSLAPAEPEILWDPELLKELVTEAVELTEKKHIKDMREAAEKAQLGAQLISEIAKDAHYVPAFKNTFNKSAPRALAKLLNRFGVSGKYSDEALCALAGLSIWFRSYRQDSRLAELIEEDRRNRNAKSNPQSGTGNTDPRLTGSGPGTQKT